MTSESRRADERHGGATPGPPPPRRPVRRLLREALVGCVLAALSVLLVVAAVETVLRLWGPRAPERWFVAGRGAEAGTVRPIRHRPSPRLPLRLGPVSFAALKPPGALRIVCLGDSTVFGYPYGPRGTPPRALEILLSAALAGRPVEVVNGGYLGADSDRALSLMRELLPYGPDAFMVYVGHNEFLRYDEAHQYDVRFDFNPEVTLPADVALSAAFHRSALWRWACGTDLGLSLRGWWLQRRTGLRVGRSGLVGERVQRLRFSSYEANLREMATLCRAQGVALVLCTVAGNNRSQKPLLRPPGSAREPAARAEREERTREAEAALAEGRPEEALEAASRMAASDGGDPTARFLAGRARLALGQAGAARVDLEAAIRLDGLRHRAFDTISETVRAIAASAPGATLCDVRRELEAVSPHGIIGEELLVDHVHPNLEGMVRLARLWQKGLEAAGVVEPAPAEGGALTDEQVAARIGLDRAAIRDSILRLAISAVGQVHPDRAAALFRIAATLYGPEDSDAATAPVYFRGLAALVSGNVPEARRLIGEARALDPAFTDRMNRMFAQLRIDERLR